jgi:hypothetical protein
MSSRERWEAGRSQTHMFMVAEEFKQVREQWYLGNFVRLYNESADINLVFGEHLPERKSPQPDFALYDDARVLRSYIEVTEWLEPYRRRDQEYNRPFEGGAKHVGGIGVNLPSPIKSLEVLLQKKVRKKSPSYPRNTWLLVDDNVGLADYEWANRPLGDVEVARRVVDNLKGELRNISQVWLLREVGTPMTVHRLYPVE